MSLENITGIIIIILNVAGLCFMLIMAALTIINKFAGQGYKTAISSNINNKPMKRGLNSGDLNIDGGEDIFGDMDLMDFDELNLDDFD